MDTQPQAIVLAVDPGLAGGLAWKTPDRNSEAASMPKTEKELWNLLEKISGLHISSPLACNTAYVEDVGGFAGVRQPGSAMFKFGFNAGLLRGMLIAQGWRIELCRPQRWQATFGLGTARSCGSKAEWKRKLKAEAERRFPHLTVTLATADALLILDHALQHRP